MHCNQSQNQNPEEGSFIFAWDIQPELFTIFQALSFASSNPFNYSSAVLMHTNGYSQIKPMTDQNRPKSNFSSVQFQIPEPDPREPAFHDNFTQHHPSDIFTVWLANNLLQDNGF